ncbi:unnamed protein product [Coregonus sp. 'balchen']|nr:unnamed protein product [Coregonus sp. 'balchen']
MAILMTLTPPPPPLPIGPLPPQNLSLAHVTSNSAQVTWDRHPRNLPDGFVVNVTRGLSTRSRFLPNGKLETYTLRELSPGQHYHLALVAVRKTGQEQIHSVPQHLAFTTLPMEERWGGRTRERTYTELIDGRGRITAKFTNLPRKAIRHRTKPEPPIQRMEETTNKISLALEIQMKEEEEGSRRKPVCQRVPHPCTRLYSETKSVPVWVGEVWHYLYKRTYKVQQDVCYREICEPPLLPKKSPSEFD